MKKNAYYVTVTLTFDPRSPISIGSEPVLYAANFAKTTSKLVHPFGWNNVHKKSGHTDRQTDRQTHRQTDKLE